ncbi:hypothetical protein C8R43DRAFT_928328 [Mycena crocata]|nr:hypothetical protein C8R43DRAFT_928328 [Mycena crocata]
MSNSNSSLQCMGIEPNPDIAGIGVRIAIYVQALLSIVYPIFFVWDGRITAKESGTMSRISINITLTACALLVSTGIQAATFGISLYHALIILQLSWINSMTFMTVYVVARAARSINQQLLTHLSPRLASQLAAEPFTSVPKNLLRSREALMASLHFIVVGGIGIWVWGKISTFGSQVECNQDTFLVILSKTIYVTHGPVIRRISLALYGISLIPIGNVWIMRSLLGGAATLGRVLLFCLVIIPGVACARSIFVGLFPRFGGGETQQNEADVVKSIAYSRLMFYFAISGMATAMIILIANTEQMIHKSSSLVKPGEGDWTFGQTLVLLLLFLPIWEAVAAIRETDDTSSSSSSV